MIIGPVGNGHVVCHNKALDHGVVIEDHSDFVIVRPSVQPTSYKWLKQDISMSPFDWIEPQIVDLRDPYTRVTLPNAEPVPDLDWFEIEADDIVLLSRVIDNIPRGRRQRVLAHINAMWAQ